MQSWQLPSRCHKQLRLRGAGETFGPQILLHNTRESCKVLTALESQCRAQLQEKRAGLYMSWTLHELCSSFAAAELGRANKALARDF